MSLKVIWQAKKQPGGLADAYPVPWVLTGCTHWCLCQWCRQRCCRDGCAIHPFRWLWHRINASSNGNEGRLYDNPFKSSKTSIYSLYTPPSLTEITLAYLSKKVLDSAFFLQKLQLKGPKKPGNNVCLKVSRSQNKIVKL